MPESGWDEGCKRKQREIQRRTQLQLEHEEVRALCRLYGSVTQEETWNKINGKTDEELIKDVEKIMLRRKKQALAAYAYAETQGLVPAYTAAGVA